MQNYSNCSECKNKTFILNKKVQLDTNWKLRNGRTYSHFNTYLYLPTYTLTLKYLDIAYFWDLWRPFVAHFLFTCYFRQYFRQRANHWTRILREKLFCITIICCSRYNIGCPLVCTKWGYESRFGCRAHRKSNIKVCRSSPI